MPISATRNMLSTIRDYELIASGAIPWAKSLKVFGYTDNVSSETTLWDFGTIYEYLQSAQIVGIASSSANDTSSGDGARTVRVTGLDEDGLFYEEEISLDGQTPVNTSKKFFRVFGLDVVTAGTLGGADGVVQCGIGPFIDGEATQVLAQISGDINQALMAMITIPADKVGFSHEYYSNTGKSGEVVIDSLSRKNDEVFRVIRRLLLYENSFTYNNEIPFFFTPLTDIELRASASVQCPVSAGFDIILVDKDKLFS